MSKDKIIELIEKFFSGTLLPEEETELRRWYSNSKSLALSDPGLEKEEKEMLKEKMLNALLLQVRETEPLPAIHSLKKYVFFKKIAAAAAILLLISGGIFFYLYRAHLSANKQPAIAIAKHTITNDIRPGHNGATLHLSNGQSIALDNLQDGTIAQQVGIQIIKDKGKIVYVGKANKVVYNDITTTRGQQWQLTLPDGTRVWLNAASSIHYPLFFNGKERVVSITGEAYFEVVHNDRQPFKVKAGNILIEDIGTSFNVNAYTSEPAIKTTLVQGSVAVSTPADKMLLTPGQQAVAQIDNSIQVRKANIESAIAWKNGEIVFDNEDFQTIMRQISRWYDVSVTYRGRVPQKTFTGGISRQLNLSEFLKILEFENVRFTLSGKNLIITE